MTDSLLFIALLSISLARFVCSLTGKQPTKIQQATYSHPINHDPVIFNEPASTNAPQTQLRGEVYWPQTSHHVAVIIMFSGMHPDGRTEIHVPGYGMYPWDSGAINANGSCNGAVVQGYRGFDYLGRMLAQQGYGAILIDPLFINNSPFQAENDTTLDAARARLLLKIIGKLKEWNSHSEASQSVLGFDISNTAELSKIGVVGHSRGGAAVRLAYNMLMTPEKPPVEERVDWKRETQASITSVMEVAPLFQPEEGARPSVVGAPGALVGAGCESDEIDFGMLIESSLPN